MTPPSDFDRLPFDLAARIDAACDRFDAAWRAGGRPRLEDHLADFDGPDRPCVLRELLATELERRGRLGERPVPGDYLGRFPDDSNLVASAFGDLKRTMGDAEVEGRSPGPGLTEDGRKAPRTSARGLPKLPGYEILEELGRGGMGVVYKARELSLNRVVAVKMILSGDHAGPVALARFQNEAEVVARLRHPDVVQIFDLGEVDGRPFLELEYIAGGNLSRSLDGTPWPATKAAALVEVAALAVHEAHRQGVIHRDLKPSNLLMAADGRPKITDFGLAKIAEDESGLTGTGSILGSPSYMAPEQASGGLAIGPAVDVYALGAILYELLSGRPPFKAATILETLEQVRTSQVVAPSRFVPGLPRDAETVCLKCLDKSPARRYPTAEALAHDLRRLLEGRPVAARRVGPAVSLGLWCRREPKVAVLLAALGLAGLGSSAVFAWQWRRLQDQVAVSRAGRIEADGARARSDEHYRKARTVLDELTAIAGRMAGQPRLEKARREVYEKILNFNVDLLGEDRPEPAALFETAMAYSRVGRIRTELGQFDQACLAFEGEAAVLERLLAIDPADRAYRVAMAGCQFRLGIALRKAPKAKGGAREAMKRALALREGLAADPAAGPDDRSSLASVLSNLASIYTAENAFDEAEAIFPRAIAASREALADSPANLNFMMNLGVGLEGWGDLLVRKHGPADAEGPLREALALHERVERGRPGVGDSHYYAARSRARLADVLMNLGRRDDAQSERRKVCTTLRAYLKGNPDHLDCRNVLAETSLEYAEWVDRREQDEAIAAFRTAQGEFEGLMRAFPANARYRVALAQTRARIGGLLLATRRVEAEEHFAAALALVPAEPSVLNNVAWFLANSAGATSPDHRRAIKLAEEAVRLNPGEPDGWNTLGVARYRAGDLAEARKALDHAIEIRRGGTEPVDGLVLAMTCWKLGDRGRARDQWKQTDAWIREHGVTAPEAIDFRAEARALIVDGEPGAEPPGPAPGSPRATVTGRP